MHERSERRYPDKTIWLYTGSLWEEIQQYEIIHYLDVCVDGEFQVDKKEVRLKWKGSSNQRVIDVQASLRENRVGSVHGVIRGFFEITYWEWNEK